MELLVPKRQSVSIELNGERVASASAVKCVCVKERRAIRAFGEAEPVAWLDLSPSYRLELSQLSGLGQSISRSSLWEIFALSPCRTAYAPYTAAASGRS